MTSAVSPGTTDAAMPDSLASCAVAAERSGTDLAWTLAIATSAFGRLATEAMAGLPGGQRGFLVLATAVRGLPRSQLALAHQLGVDKTAMTYLLDELEAAGLIERRPDPADRRARQVLITADGQRALRDCGQRLRAAEDKLLAPLTADEAGTLRALLDRVARVTCAGREACSADAGPVAGPVAGPAAEC